MEFFDFDKVKEFIHIPEKNTSETPLSIKRKLDNEIKSKLKKSYTNKIMKKKKLIIETKKKNFVQNFEEENISRDQRRINRQIFLMTQKSVRIEENLNKKKKNKKLFRNLKIFPENMSFENLAENSENNFFEVKNYDLENNFDSLMKDETELYKDFQISKNV